MITIARAVCTCPSVPSQWDAWTPDGQYLYLRYRFGRGTVEQHPSEDPDTWDYSRDLVIAEFADPDQPYAGDIELDEFLRRAGLELAPDAEVIPFR